jgi:hypothetical protein
LYRSTPKVTHSKKDAIVMIRLDTGYLLHVYNVAGLKLAMPNEQKHY